MKKICCVGDNCIDYYEDMDMAKLGGNPVNVSVYIKQLGLSLIHISEPTRLHKVSRMPSSA